MRLLMRWVRRAFPSWSLVVLGALWMALDGYASPPTACMAPARNTQATYRPISSQDIVDAIAHNTTLSLCAIPRGELARAITLAQHLGVGHSLRIEHCLIDGDVTLDAVIVPFSIAVHSSRFVGDVRLRDVAFHRPVELSAVVLGNLAAEGQTVFHDRVHFRGVDLLSLDLQATFKKEAGFDMVVFERAQISHSMFGGPMRVDSSTFCDGLTVEKTAFAGDVMLRDVMFAGDRTRLQDVSVVGDLSFARSTIENASILDTTIGGPDSLGGQVSFHEAIIGNLTVRGVTFHKNADFAGIRPALYRDFEGRVTIAKGVFKGPVTWQDTHLRTLSLLDPTSDGESGSAAQFGQSVVLSGTRISFANFSGTRWGGKVDFSNATFVHLLDLRGAEFGGDVDFQGSVLPAVDPNPDAWSGVQIAGTTFSRVNVEHEQLVEPMGWWGLLRMAGRAKVVPDNDVTWKGFEDRARAAGDLPNQNEAAYRRYVVQRSEQSWGGRFWSWVQSVFWGYGYRPERLLMLLMLTCGGFSTWYYSCLRSTRRDRATKAVWFGLRNTFWKTPRDPETELRIPRLRTAVISQWVASKILLGFLAASMTYQPIVAGILKS